MDSHPVPKSGLVLEPSKKYTQKVDQTFHISQASLDLKSCDQEPIQLLVEYENSNFVLATLCKKANIFQVPLDLIFKAGDQVSFRTIGNGKVHLSGYHILEDLDSMIMNGEEESDIDEMEVFEQTKGKRKKSSLKSKGNKKAKLVDGNEKESDEEDDNDEDDEEDDDEEMDDDEDEENISPSKKGKKKKGKAELSFLSMEDDDEDNEEEDDDDDDDDDDEEDDEEEDEDDFEFEEEDEDLEDMDESENEKVKTPKQQNKKNTVSTPNGIASVSKGKDKSAQKQNKNKKDAKAQGTPGKEGKTPKNEGKASKHDKHGESSPQRKGSDNAKNVEKTPKTPKQDGSPQKKVLEGGVISEEIVVGDGPIAKPGRMVQVYYVGTLASTKKQFDSVQGGPGFKFRLGRNEVIKGWDIGVNGMKVGGKRKLTIPPHLGYGSKGSPPVIPPNSTLVFTVELKGLS